MRVTVPLRLRAALVVSMSARATSSGDGAGATRTELFGYPAQQRSLRQAQGCGCQLAVLPG